MTAVDLLGRGGCVSTILARILPEHCGLVSSSPLFYSGGRGLKSWTRSLLSWLMSVIIFLNLFTETLSKCTSDLAIAPSFHVLSSFLFTAHSSTWPYVVGLTQNIVKELQLNKDCISHFATFLCCNSLVGNLPSNSCIRGWSDQHSLTHVTAVVNGLGVYSAIRGGKKYSYDARAACWRRALWKSFRYRSTPLQHWQMGNTESDQQALNTSESLHMKLVMLVTGIVVGRCFMLSQYNVRKRWEKQEAMPVCPNHDSLSLSPPVKISLTIWTKGRLANLILVYTHREWAVI